MFLANVKLYLGFFTFKQNLKLYSYKNVMYECMTSKLIICKSEVNNKSFQKVFWGYVLDLWTMFETVIKII